MESNLVLDAKDWAEESRVISHTTTRNKILQLIMSLRRESDFQRLENPLREKQRARQQAGKRHKNPTFNKFLQDCHEYSSKATVYRDQQELDNQRPYEA